MGTHALQQAPPHTLHIQAQVQQQTREMPNGCVLTAGLVLVHNPHILVLPP
jgi:hypothetical protein